MRARIRTVAPISAVRIRRVVVAVMAPPIELQIYQGRFRFGGCRTSSRAGDINPSRQLSPDLSWPNILGSAGNCGLLGDLVSWRAPVLIGAIKHGLTSMST